MKGANYLFGYIDKLAEVVDQYDDADHTDPPEAVDDLSLKADRIQTGAGASEGTGTLSRASSYVGRGARAALGTIGRGVRYTTGLAGRASRATGDAIGDATHRLFSWRSGTGRTVTPDADHPLYDPESGDAISYDDAIGRMLGHGGGVSVRRQDGRTTTISHSQDRGSDVVLSDGKGRRIDVPEAVSNVALGRPVGAYVPGGNTYTIDTGDPRGVIRIQALDKDPSKEEDYEGYAPSDEEKALLERAHDDYWNSVLEGRMSFEDMADVINSAASNSQGASGLSDALHAGFMMSSGRLTEDQFVGLNDMIDSAAQDGRISAEDRDSLRFELMSGRLKPYMDSGYSYDQSLYLVDPDIPNIQMLTDLIAGSNAEGGRRFDETEDSILRKYMHDVAHGDESLRVAYGYGAVVDIIKHRIDVDRKHAMDVATGKDPDTVFASGSLLEARPTVDRMISEMGLSGGQIPRIKRRSAIDGSVRKVVDEASLRNMYYSFVQKRAVDPYLNDYSLAVKMLDDELSRAGVESVASLTRRQ